MYFSRKGIVNPSDLALLRGALDEFCASRHMENLMQREDLAAHLLVAFNIGIHDPEALLTELAKHALPTLESSPDST